MLAFLRDDPLKLTHASASFFLTSRKLDNLVRRNVHRIKLPTHLFLAAADRIIDNPATIALLQPTAPRVQTYPNAHHTLDFEPDPTAFFTDLATRVPGVSPAPKRDP